VEPQEATVEEVLSRGGSVSIIDLVEALVRQAYLVGASDIHIDPTDVALRVRMRVDGVLQEKFFLSRSIHSEIISRIKVLSWLRTDEHQAVQDGRFRLLSDGAMPIDVRVSIVPTYYGENAVLRLLIDTPEQHTLATLGFSEDDQQKILRAVRHPDGMVLATGPTGSGKTTTLYTLLKMLNTSEVSIVTIEDPVEYAISNVTQIQTQAKTGLTFATGLRSILRQDPNIIMVGEIRDKETAGIAVNAALTGHLLLSTLHTSNAAATLPRLLDMGVDSYLVASTVSLVIGQRLVRKICTECRSPYVLSSNERESLQSVLQGAPDDPFFIGQGCVVCDGSGYRGRVGVDEVLVVDTSVRDALLARESAAHIHALAVKNGMTPMLQNGLHKARLGLTSIAELLRTMHE